MADERGNEAPELPGFYFDPAKNRYYRILPGHSNPNPVTSRPLQSEKSKRFSGSSNHRRKVDKKVGKCSLGISKLLHKRSLGLSAKNNISNFEFDIVRAKLKSWDEECDIASSNDYLVTDMLPSPDYSMVGIIAGVFPEDSYRSAGVIRDYYFSAKDTCLFTASYKCSSICFGKEGNLLFLLCTDVQHSTVSFCALKKEWCDQFNACNLPDPLEKTLKRGTPFTCATSKDPFSYHKLSYSDGKSVVLVSNISAHFSPRVTTIHPSGGPGYSACRLHRDVLAQCFDHQSRLHFNGLRGGQIVALDLTRKLGKPYACVWDFKSKQNVSQLLSLSDGHSLLVGYKNPECRPSMYLWDIRFSTKPVLEYLSDCPERCPEDRSTYNYRLNVDKNEQILTSVLPDLKVRLWSIKTGEMLLKYPKNDDDKVAAAIFSTDWGLMRGNSGLLMYIHGQDPGFSWKTL